MKHVACPLCGRDEAHEELVARDRLGLAAGSFTLVRCGGCGLVYLDPRPDEEEILSCYPKEYWGGRERGLREVLRCLEERVKEDYKLAAVVAAGLRGGRVLDVGCGRGEFMALLEKKGFTTVGIEPGAEAAERGRRESGLDIIHGTLEGAGLQEESFDAVTMWHVLEHFPDPLGALVQVRGLLRPGGRLIAALPDFGSIQAGWFRDSWFGIDAPRHLTHFTRGTLSAMLERAEFRVQRFISGGARYETAMLVRSAFPGLNRRKLDALERGSPARYPLKALQLMLDTAIVPAGFVLAASGRASSFVVIASRYDGG